MKNKVLIFSVAGIAAASAVGIAVSLIFTLLGMGDTSSVAAGAVHIVVVGLLFLTLIVEIVSAATIEDSTYHTALITGCLFIQYLCSADGALFFADMGLRLHPAVYGIVSEIAFLGAVAGCCAYVMYLYKLRLNTIFLVVLPILAALLFAVYAVTLFHGYGYIAHFVVAALAAAVFCSLIFFAEKNNKIGMTTYFVTAVVCLSFGAQNANAMYYSGLTVALQGISLFFAALTFAMYVPVYLMFCIRTDSKAVKSIEYQRQAALFEAKAMLGQIKPHFIFNSLETIRSLYHRDAASGDTAMNYLSDFLRDSINSFDHELIPFETEIDTVFSYTEFENIKREHKIEVVFDLDFVDFRVPPFSVQPFVENAFKYSGVGEIPGGNIIISSYKSGDFAAIEIADNGRGFDVNKISEHSHGIRNACGRFALTLGVTPEITAAPGKGTKVKILIDLRKEAEKQ